MRRPGPGLIQSAQRSCRSARSPSASSRRRRRVRGYGRSRSRPHPRTCRGSGGSAPSGRAPGAAGDLPLSSGGVRSATAPHQNTWPITEARCRTERSRGSSRSRRAASTAWTVGARGSTRRPSSPAGAVALHEDAFLDEHAQHLLEEERVAAGCAPDGVGGILMSGPRVLEQLPRVVALQRRQLDRRRPPTQAVAPRDRGGLCSRRESARRGSSPRGTRSGRGTPARPTGRRRERAARADHAQASRAAAGKPSRVVAAQSAARRARRLRAGASCTARRPARRRGRVEVEPRTISTRASR